MMLFERHGELKYKLGNRNFWATGYYGSAVGLNEAYIQEQEKEDQIEDKMMKKGYKNPLKG